MLKYFLEHNSKNRFNHSEVDLMPMENWKATRIQKMLLITATILSYFHNFGALELPFLLQALAPVADTEVPWGTRNFENLPEHSSFFLRKSSSPSNNLARWMIHYLKIQLKLLHQSHYLPADSSDSIIFSHKSETCGTRNSRMLEESLRSIESQLNLDLDLLVDQKQSEAKWPGFIYLLRVG
ncbi:hypothetical protein Leryth_009136 [Lithospermum erythrorhizon]|nr:hypothetical protein Leryth_009136 [Lithospermum erythrorhizon]